MYGVFSVAQRGGEVSIEGLHESLCCRKKEKKIYVSSQVSLSGLVFLR